VELLALKRRQEVTVIASSMNNSRTGAGNLLLMAWLFVACVSAVSCVLAARAGVKGASGARPRALPAQQQQQQQQQQWQQWASAGTKQDAVWQQQTYTAALC
jgi:hypothetical protein